MALKNRLTFRSNFLPSFLIRESAKLSEDFLQDKLPRNMIAPFTVRYVYPKPASVNTVSVVN